MPFSCAAARPCAICTAKSSAVRGGSGAAAQSVAQRLAFEQLRHDVRRAVVAADVVDREDVRVIQRRGGARFLLEAPKPAPDRHEASRAGP